MRDKRTRFVSKISIKLWFLITFYLFYRSRKRRTSYSQDDREDMFDSDEMDECNAALVLMSLSCSPNSPHPGMIFVCHFSLLSFQFFNYKFFCWHFDSPFIIPTRQKTTNKQFGNCWDQVQETDIVFNHTAVHRHHRWVTMEM
jgi:hypothetical protein